ncbi:MAG TPA: hypothetical protein VD788_16215, partial [Candidatus Polarisedimenticolaceae bacterium]|nr:hypothetical protein [Candidatus Polarisedimenticolaceae bacterium]
MPGSRRSEPPHAPTGGERLVGAVTEIDGVVVLPVLHERLEFADCVRRLMREVRFDAVAVEIPSSLERAWLGAVDRLPQVSGLLYENAAGRTIFLAVQPADPLVEAARAAREAGLPVRCADLDVDGYADYRDPLPDPYCVKRLGLAAVCRSFDAVPRRRDPEDGRREAAMAYHARELRAQGARHVLLVCGMHHARSVADELGREQAIPHTTPARRDLRTVHLHPDSLSEVLAEIPFYVAVYERHRAGCPAPRPPHAGGAPAVRRGPFRVISGEGRERADRVAEAI